MIITPRFISFPIPTLPGKKTGSPPDFDPTSTMVVDSGTSYSNERITRRSRIVLATGTPLGAVTQGRCSNVGRETMLRVLMLCKCPLQGCRNVYYRRCSQRDYGMVVHYRRLVKARHSRKAKSPLFEYHDIDFLVGG